MDNSRDATSETGGHESPASSEVPIVPLAAFGVDEMYTIFAREPWIGRRLLGDVRYDIPLFWAVGARRYPDRHG